MTQQHFTAIDRRQARQDRDAFLFFKPARDFQMGLAFAAAAAAKQDHPLAEQIGRVIRKLA